MRLLLFLLGVFVAVICAEKPAAAQNGGWCGSTDWVRSSRQPPLTAAKHC